MGSADPTPSAIKPMLAVLVDEPFVDDDWLFELKWDGVRAVAFFKDGHFRFQSRNRLDLTPLFPELQLGPASVRAESAVLDGEIVTFDASGRPSFQKLQRRLGLTRASDVAEAAAGAPVVYYAFDLLYLDGRDLRNLALVERRRLLEAALSARQDPLRLSEAIRGQGVKLFESAKAKSFEGIMAKRARSRYEEKRSRDWLKIKAVKTQDCVVCGFTEPQGTREYFGALVLGVIVAGGLTYAGHVGTGFDNGALSELYRLMEPLETGKCPFTTEPDFKKPIHWLTPRLVCEVKFTEWTSDGSMRHPSFVGLRSDKQPSDCVREAARRGPTAPGGLGAGSTSANEAHVEIEERVLRLTNPGKVFWPLTGETKGDLIEYYFRASDLLLPHLRDRPMVLKRYPNGIHGDHFWQKDAPAELPSWIETVMIPEGGHENRYILVNDRPTLVYLVNLGCIDLNPWSSRIGSLDRPDWLIIDLDPFDVPFSAVVEVALACRAVVERLGLTGYPKTSGATGMHIFLPLEPIYTYLQVRQMAEIVAKLTLEKAAGVATLEPEVSRRRGRVYIDWLQNVQGKTVASVYSVRPEPGATVSTPLTWEEVTVDLDPATFTIERALARPPASGDKFSPVLTNRQRLEGALEKLASAD